jgi:predicted transcriptional regulator
MSSTVPITIRVPPELADELKKLADGEERTLSQFCMRVLREYVAGRKGLKKR